MSFFRRRRKDKDEPVKEEEPAPARSKPTRATTPPVESTSSPSIPDDLGDSPAATPVPLATPPVIAPTEERPRSPPPPLPDRATPPAGALPIVPRPLSQCFVCGTALEEGQCAKCRMTWIE
jgi:hypothetical protein